MVQNNLIIHSFHLNAHQKIRIKFHNNQNNIIQVTSMILKKELGFIIFFLIRVKNKDEYWKQLGEFKKNKLNEFLEKQRKEE